jgi:hypothetical protein
VGKFRCKVCDDKAAAKAVDEELRKGVSAAGVAKLMTMRGFAVTAPTILGHKQHAVQSQVAAPPDLKKRDLAVMVRDKVADLVEDDEIDFLDKNHMAAVGMGLKAQAEINKQVNKAENKEFKLSIFLSGASLGRLGVPAALLIDDGNTVDGEFEPVDE